jgi:hypothetical protein
MIGGCSAEPIRVDRDRIDDCKRPTVRTKLQLPALLERGLLAIMDISARAISLAERPQRAIRVTSVRTRREDRTSISSHPLADLGRVRFED